MSRVRTATLLIAMILLAVAAALWLTPKVYGITLVFEGTKLVIDGKEVCKDIGGSVIVKFGNEFHSVDICELIEKKVVYVFFSEGVEYWTKTLEGMGVRPEMYIEEILAALEGRGYGIVTMPTVSVTFWLITEDLHYISNDMFTSLDYYISLGYSYSDAFNRMLKNPLAIVKERGTIVIRPKELLRGLVPINVTRAIEGVRKELGLEITLPSGGVSTQGGCPPGTIPVATGVCKWENYWGLPDVPPEWFYNRTIVIRGDKNSVVANLWNKFKGYFGSAYFVRKDLYPNERSAVYRLLQVWGNPCFKFESDLGRPIDMSTVLGTCLYGSSYQVSWNYTRSPGSIFTMYKPLVIMVNSSIGEMPPIRITLEYGVFSKRTGLSVMGVLIYGNEGYNVGGGVGSTSIDPWDWSRGARSAALIIPAYMKYLGDFFIFTWNIRSVEYPEYGSFWLFEPVPVIAPYYEEVGWAPSINWKVNYYDQDGNCIYGGCKYPRNIYDLLEEVIGALPRDYYLINGSRVSDIPKDFVLLDLSTLDPSNITSAGYMDLLGSLIFGIAKSVAADLFLGNISGPFGRLLGFIGYTDATFSESAVIQTLW